MAEYKFVKELPDDYQCMICAKVLNEPHLTDCCGQHFCQACLEQWFKKQAKKICPHCRSESFNHMRYLPLKRKIDELEIYCPNRNEGCTVITKLGELNSHKNGCGYRKVICSQGCGKSILRRNLTQHYSNECSKRMIKCKYCGIVDQYEVINGEHMTICKEYPVNCPRGCTLHGGIKRKDLAEHAEICPLKVVQCPFYEAGCDVKVLRKDLSVHMESNNQQHLMKMMMAYSKLHSEHSKLKEEFKQLSSQVTSLTLIEPVKLTDENNSFSFTVTSSQGWTSPPFCVLDGYTFCIKHKEGKTASLMLLKGKNDDNLKWPMNLQYRLKVLSLGKQNTQLRSHHSQQTILDFDLSTNLERVSFKECSKEIANVIIPVAEILNHTMTTNLVTTPSLLLRDQSHIHMGQSSMWQCEFCTRVIPGVPCTFHIHSCPFCLRQQSYIARMTMPAAEAESLNATITD